MADQETEPTLKELLKQADTNTKNAVSALEKIDDKVDKKFEKLHHNIYDALFDLREALTVIERLEIPED